jgi:hypothetical protein
MPSNIKILKMVKFHIDILVQIGLETKIFDILHWAIVLYLLKE